MIKASKIAENEQLNNKFKILEDGIPFFNLNQTENNISGNSKEKI
jgi:hypothetical protein